MEVISRHRHTRGALRPPLPGRLRPRDRLLGRPGGHGAPLGGRGRASPPRRRPGRRARRPARERRVVIAMDRVGHPYRAGRRRHPQLDTIDRYLANGADRVVLGTAAVTAGRWGRPAPPRRSHHRRRRCASWPRRPAGLAGGQRETRRRTSCDAWRRWACRASSSPTSAATAPCVAPTSRRSAAGAGLRTPVIASGGVATVEHLRRSARAGCGGRHRRPRPLRRRLALGEALAAVRRDILGEPRGQAPLARGVSPRYNRNHRSEAG